MYTANERPVFIQIQRPTFVGRDCNSRPGSRSKHGSQFEGTLVFAALERGSTWATPTGPAHAHVVHQDSSESPKDFARRVVRALTDGGHLRALARLTLVLALAHGTRIDQLEARCSIGTALLRHFSDVQFELVLVCNRDASGDDQAQARALAEGLCEGQRSRSVSVCLDA
jgi:hypothetical protein